MESLWHGDEGEAQQVEEGEGGEGGGGLQGPFLDLDAHEEGGEGDLLVVGVRRKGGWSESHQCMRT